MDGSQRINDQVCTLVFVCNKPRELEQVLRLDGVTFFIAMPNIIPHMRKMSH